MSYIYRNLLSDEQILFFTKKHRIVFFFPVVCTVLAAIVSHYIHQYSALANLESAPWLVALILWIYSGLDYWSSEYAVTDKRVMMREGFFYRHATELRLATISQINIDQGLIGQMLDYGTVSINSFGAYDAFNWVAKPGQFQKVMNEQLDKISRR